MLCCVVLCAGMAVACLINMPTYTILRSAKGTCYDCDTQSCATGLGLNKTVVSAPPKLTMATPQSGRFSATAHGINEHSDNNGNTPSFQPPNPSNTERTKHYQLVLTYCSCSSNYRKMIIGITVAAALDYSAAITPRIGELISARSATIQKKVSPPTAF